jgi:D-tyrosyl-tRNA(Tyr) deacylase
VRAVVQRARWARVSVGGEVVGELSRPGLVALVGVTHGDGEREARQLADRIWRLRILDDDEGRMNLSAADHQAPVLVVSQFTLYGDTSRGRRPSYVQAAPGEVAEGLVEAVVSALRSAGAEVATGRFGAEMLVELGNDGPVTILLEVGKDQSVEGR